jgi:hypothetical protein
MTDTPNQVAKLKNALKRRTQALQVIAEALREPDGDSYWPARRYLDRYQKFHEDLNGTRVLLQVAQLGLGRKIK